MNNYFYIDGSALTAQIRQLQRADPSFVGRKLCPKRFINYLIRALPELHNRSYKRMTFYFPKGDEAAVDVYLDMPDHKHPGEIRDIHFKFCGEKLKKSAEFDKFVEENVPPKFQARFSKSEKGIDIEMCCDALKLASASRIDRLFLLSNDGDFIPFCRTVKEFGVNISIIHLSDIVPPNTDLLHEADSYDVVPIVSLQEMFVPQPQTPQLPLDPIVAEVAEKPVEEDVVVPSVESDEPETTASDLIDLKVLVNTEEVDSDESDN